MWISEGSGLDPSLESAESDESDKSLDRFRFKAMIRCVCVVERMRSFSVLMLQYDAEPLSRPARVLIYTSRA